jgi:KRAB domain-containing zinc finger protein
MASLQGLETIYEFEAVEEVKTVEEHFPRYELKPTPTKRPEEDVETKSETDHDLDGNYCKDLPESKSEIKERSNTEDRIDEHSISLSKIVCCLCNKLFATKDNLKQHIIFVHKKQKNFPCETCTKTFHTKYKLTMHITNVHTKSGEYICKFCNKRFFRKVDQISHERIHTGEKPFQCEDCDGAFHRKEILKRHKNAVHLGIKYPCSLCKYEAHEKDHLKKHIKNVHKNEAQQQIKEYILDEIKVENESTEEINKQIMKALKDLEPKTKVKPTNERDLYCETCTKKFIIKDKRRRHTRRVHREKKRNFCCEFCSKTFTRGEHLSMHVKVLHHRIKDISCEFCGDLFSTKQALKKHGRIHTSSLSNQNQKREGSSSLEPESEDMKTANSVTYDYSAQEDILKYFVSKDTQLVQ